MLKNLFNFFFPRSVNGVMASFQKTVDDLNKVAAHHVAKHEKYETKIEDLLAEVDSHVAKQVEAEDEANAARDLAAKLTKAFGLAE